MELLGVGLPELVFILIIALLILGPKDMEKTGRTIGRWLNQLINSDTWKVLRQGSRELRNLPTNLMREANLEMKKTDAEIRGAMNNRPAPRSMPVGQQNTINPPGAVEAQSAPPQSQENKETESEPKTNA